LTVKGNEIFIKADITTDFNQTYIGHVQIGDNGQNGLIRSLISLDPAISFYGIKVLGETVVNGSPVLIESNDKFTFDDESINPTHTLILKAKGYCYVGLGCGVPGNIRKALDPDPVTNPTYAVRYEGIRRLAALIDDNAAMIFPSNRVFNPNIILDSTSILKGEIQGTKATAVDSNLANSNPVNYQHSTRPQSETPIITIKPGIPPGNPGFVAGAVGRVASLSDAKSISAFIPVKNNLSGDVVIGNVSASFIDSGSSTPSNSSSNCKAESKAECK
jgi:hypothetical protein